MFVIIENIMKRPVFTSEFLGALMAGHKANGVREVV
jgi:hypothetical protein